MHTGIHQQLFLSWLTTQTSLYGGQIWIWIDHYIQNKTMFLEGGSLSFISVHSDQPISIIFVTAINYHI